MIHKNKNAIAAFLIVVCISTLLLVTPVSSAGIVIGRGTFPSITTQTSPNGLGPDIFYGHPVELRYSLTVRWISVTYPNGDVRQTLTASGTVDIFDASSLVFIETRRCTVSIRFYDVGGDATTGAPGYFYNWDPYDPVLMSNFERFYHLHHVTGVYLREAWVYYGVDGGQVTVYTRPPTIFVV
jgi:hypothetical protein